MLIRQQHSEQELSQLGEVPVLSDVFQKARIEALGLREASDVARERANATLARLDREIAELAVPDELLTESEAIERLRDGLGADRKARKTIPAEETKLLQALASVQDLLAELQPDLRQRQESSSPRKRRVGQRRRLRSCSRRW